MTNSPDMEVSHAALQAQIDALDKRVTALEQGEEQVPIPPVDDTFEWTAFAPSELGNGEGLDYDGPGTRMIYVSSSTGDDNNPGTYAKPIKTLAKTYHLMRNGKPDWCLLKRGDTWKDEAFGRDNNGHQLNDSGGQDADNPWLFTSYGEGERPIIKSNGNVSVWTVGWGTQRANFFAFIGLDCLCYTRDPSDPDYAGPSNAQSAITWLQAHDDMWLLVEDCRFRFYQGAFYTDPGAPSTGVRGGTLICRRNVIHQNWGGPNYGGTGCIGSFVKNVLFEGCFFNENAMAPDDDPAWACPMNSNSHNIYWQDTNGILEYHDNINTNGQYNLLKARCGVNASNNFFARGAEAISDYTYAGSVFGFPTVATAIMDNVFLELRPIDRRMVDDKGNPQPQAGGGCAIEVASIADGSLPIGMDYPGPVCIQRNIIAHQLATYPAWAILLSESAADCVVSDNIIYNCTNGVGNVSTHANTIVNNDVNLPRENYSDPDNATLGKYYESIGGTDDFDAFCEAAAEQCRDNWNVALTAPAINDWMRSKFGMARALEPKP